ncbi:MAG: TetR/AcrR family transcriptional regulator [Caulobacterales bacterium]
MDDPRAEAILVAAFQVFVENGFERATMLEIATLAKVSKQTLYALFADKDGLFEALMRWGSMRHAQLPSVDSEIDPAAALHAIAFRTAREVFRWQSLALTRIAFSEAPRRPKLAAFYRTQASNETNAPLLEQAHILEKHGIIRPGASESFARDLASLLRGQLYYDAMLGVTPPPPKAQIETHARSAVETALRAYAGKPSARAKLR